MPGRWGPRRPRWRGGVRVHRVAQPELEVEQAPEALGVVPARVGEEVLEERADGGRVGVRAGGERVGGEHLADRLAQGEQQAGRGVVVRVAGRREDGVHQAGEPPARHAAIGGALVRVGVDEGRVQQRLDGHVGALAGVGQACGDVAAGRGQGARGTAQAAGRVGGRRRRGGAAAHVRGRGQGAAVGADRGADRLEVGDRGRCRGGGQRCGPGTADEEGAVRLPEREVAVHRRVVGAGGDLGRVGRGVAHGTSFRDGGCRTRPAAAGRGSDSTSGPRRAFVRETAAPGALSFGKRRGRPLARGCGPDHPRGVLHRDRRAGAHAVRGRVRSFARPGGDAAGAGARGRRSGPGALTYGTAGLDDDAGPVARPGWCMVVPAPQAEAERLRGRSSMVERLLPKQDTRVRFPSPAPRHDDGPGPLTRGTRGRVAPRRPATAAPGTQDVGMRPHSGVIPTAGVPGRRVGSRSPQRPARISRSRRSRSTGRSAAKRGSRSGPASASR